MSISETPSEFVKSTETLILDIRAELRRIYSMRNQFSGEASLTECLLLEAVNRLEKLNETR